MLVFTYSSAFLSVFGASMCFFSSFWLRQTNVTNNTRPATAKMIAAAAFDLDSSTLFLSLDSSFGYFFSDSSLGYFFSNS